MSSPFDEIFAAEDLYGLLSVKKSASSRSTQDEMTIAHFEAINVFIDEFGIMPGSRENNREPSLEECTFEGHLDAFRSEDTYINLLTPYDRHGLLGPKPLPKVIFENVNQIIDSNDPLLHDDADDIFTLKHVTLKANVERAVPDDIAKRKTCENFSYFEPIFSKIFDDLKMGKRTMIKYPRTSSIVPGSVFTFEGLTIYVADVDATPHRGDKNNVRTRIIFSNGMESNLLVYSLARAFWEAEDSYQIIEVEPTHENLPLFTGRAESSLGVGVVTGNIYVVESLSTDPIIADLKGRLYKIGFTKRDVDQRIADAINDPTFLFAPVRKVKTFQTVYIDPHELEKLIHQFLSPARLQVDLLLGRPVTPKEWFVVPLEVITETVERIINGSILNVRYDAISQKITRK